MQQSTNSSSRKKFIFWSAAALVSVSALRFFTGRRNKKNEMVKMLTTDGRLVEVDKSLLARGGRKITNDELQQWVKNKSSHE